MIASCDSLHHHHHRHLWHNEDDNFQQLNWFHSMFLKAIFDLHNCYHQIFRHQCKFCWKVHTVLRDKLNKCLFISYMFHVFCFSLLKVYRNRILKSHEREYVLSPFCTIFFCLFSSLGFKGFFLYGFCEYLCLCHVSFLVFFLTFHFFPSQNK